MSLDLTLLPIEYESGSVSYSHTMIPLQSNSIDLMEKIGDLALRSSQSIQFIKDDDITGKVSENFTSYLGQNKESGGPPCYGITEDDGYGQPLRWLTVRALMTLAKHPQVIKHPKNKSTWGYLAACPPELKVALFWR